MLTAIKKKRNRQAILNTHVDCLSLEETLGLIEHSIEHRISLHHVSINANKINLMKQDKQLKDIVDAAGLINADGSSILIAGKLFHVPIPERVTGIDLFFVLLKKCEEKGYRPYFFGATHEVLVQMIEIIREKYPMLEIAGYRSGYFNELENPTIVAEMNQSKADILFVGFSSPKKEYWIHNQKEKLTIPFLMGVGGSFDVLAGKTKRAPLFFQKAGMEWFYRLIQEPKRMFKRYILGNGLFVIHMIKEKWQVLGMKESD